MRIEDSGFRIQDGGLRVCAGKSPPTIGVTRLARLPPSGSAAATSTVKRTSLVVGRAPRIVIGA